MRKGTAIFLVLLAAIGITYFTGPELPVPHYGNELPDLHNDPLAIEKWIVSREDTMPVRSDNQARIVWAGAEGAITEYSIVYLHGFGGSYRDGYPANAAIADSIGANLYLARWAGHGLKPPHSLDRFTPEEAWSNAKEALLIGNRIGKRTIIMSTSTGGTLAMKLAAMFPDRVHALINLSPNIKDDPDISFLLGTHWGHEIAQLVSLGDRKKIDIDDPAIAQYWDTVIPSRSLVDLQVLVHTLATKGTFQNVRCPVITLYFHKNEFQEDEHVEIEVYPEMHAALATPDSLKELVALETPDTHFIGSGLRSKDVDVVVEKITGFLERMGIEMDR